MFKTNFTVFLLLADGAPFIMGTKDGFMSFVEKESKDVLVNHYLFYRENSEAGIVHNLF